MRDTEAVRHAIAEPWSSGQAEGQINRSEARIGQRGGETIRPIAS